MKYKVVYTVEGYRNWELISHTFCEYYKTLKQAERAVSSITESYGKTHDRLTNCEIIKLPTNPKPNADLRN